AAASASQLSTQPTASSSNDAANNDTASEMQSIAAASTSSEMVSVPRIDTLILDAGALIMRAPLAGLASEYYIPPRVIEEIRHVSGREYLESLRLRPDFKLNIVQPSPASMLAVTEFAKKTGDVAVLSKQDLEVIALTYEQEVARHGLKRVRTEPASHAKANSAASPSTSKAQAPSAEEQANKAQNAKAREEALRKKREAKLAAKHEKTRQEAEALGLTVEQLTAKRIQESKQKKEARKQARQQQQPLSTAEEPAPSAADDHEEDIDDTAEHQPGSGDPEEAAGSDSDEGDWITPDNVQKAKNLSMGLVSDSRVPGWKYGKQEAEEDETAEEASEPLEPLEEGWERVESGRSTHAKPAKRANRAPVGSWDSAPSASASSSTSFFEGGAGPGEEKLTVACITGDFAVQNVVLQMGMSLLGVHGMRVRSVKSFVLRCHACMKVCRDMEKKFCPSCGNATLTRVGCTVDDSVSGGLRLHLKANYQYNLRGSKYSIPAPKMGSSSGAKSGGSGLILYEDQVEWQRALAKEESRKRKEQRAITKSLEQGTDPLSNRYQHAWDQGNLFLSNQFAAQGDKSNLPVIGHGRRNPNANRRSRK
ncbi:hypothetical protein BCV70DRAFT_141817, partial [Testicularia cyperi]